MNINHQKPFHLEEGYPRCSLLIIRKKVIRVQTDFIGGYMIPVRVPKGFKLICRADGFQKFLIIIGTNLLT